MNDELVVCAECGCSLPRTEAYSRFILGAFFGYSSEEYLCHDCRYPEGRAVGESLPVDDPVEEEDQYDGSYEGEW